MSSIHVRSRRAHHPVIAPIKTDTSCFPDRPRRFSSRPSISYSEITHSRLNSLGCAQEMMHAGASPMRRNPSVSELMPDAPGMVAPYGTVWISRQVCPTPVSDISPHTKVWPAVLETHARRPRQMSMGHGDMFRQGTAGTRRVSYARPASRRPSRYTYRASSRSIDVELQRNQQHRLWEQGHSIFGLPEEADVLVKPLRLNRPLKEIRSWSEEPSSASPLPKRVFVRAVIRSKSHVAVALEREFDLDHLRATILDPLPCPQSSDFNREVLLSRLELSDEDLEPQSPVDAEMADDDDGDVAVKKEKQDMPPFLKHPQFVPKATTVPMSLRYARSQLPALAAVMMMPNRVRRGDTIQLAMPHPSAWPSTAAYVYTGERELLTNDVRENILYLGGKV